MILCERGFSWGGYEEVSLAVLRSGKAEHNGIKTFFTPLKACLCVCAAYVVKRLYLSGERLHGVTVVRGNGEL